MDFLYNNFNSIYIMLGSNCNAHCKYCLQQNNEHVIPTTINDNIYIFLKQIINNYNSLKKYKSASHIDTHTNINLSNEQFTIVFFGGEPLLYWDKIIEIIKKIESFKLNCHFAILSNCILLDMDKVNYCNKHNVSITVSYDGINSNKIRYYDIMQQRTNELLHVNKLLINGVLTKYMYPEDFLYPCGEFNRKYNYIHDYMTDISIETYIDRGDCNNDKLNQLDGNKLYNQISNLCNKYLNNKFNLDDPLDLTYYKFIQSIYNKLAANINNNSIIRGGCNCGWFSLNMDLQGNLYNCHNSCSPIATINNSINEYYFNLLKADTRKTFTDCNSCEIKFICGGGCKMSKEEYDNEYCKSNKAYFQPFLDTLLEWNNIKEASNG